MSKRFHRTTRVEADVVIWDGNNVRDLAELLGKPVTAQPDGSATWPDDDEGVEAAPEGAAVVKWADGPTVGQFEIIKGDDFTATFNQVRPRIKTDDAPAAPPSTPAPAAAAGRAAHAADA